MSIFKRFCGPLIHDNSCRTQECEKEVDFHMSGGFGSSYYTIECKDKNCPMRAQQLKAKREAERREILRLAGYRP